jgi:hypothetical protein
LRLGLAYWNSPGYWVRVRVGVGVRLRLGLEYWNVPPPCGTSGGTMIALDRVRGRLG